MWQKGIHVTGMQVKSSQGMNGSMMEYWEVNCCLRKDQNYWRCMLVYRWQNEGSKICKMCDKGVKETVQHLVLYCKLYEREKGNAGCSHE